MIKILAAAMTIATTPLILTSISFNGNIKEYYLQCLRTGQFDEIDRIVSTTKTADLPQVRLNQYFDGNQAAKYLCSLGSKEGDSLAYELWQKMIGTAATENQLDSAFFLAESWVKSMPGFDLPKAVLEKVKKAKGDQEKNS